MYHSDPLSGGPCTLPILGWLGAQSLCQGSVWQHGEGWQHSEGRLQRGWQLARAWGGRWCRPGHSWGGSEV